MSFSFRKRVGKTMEKGQITVPKEFDSILDRKNYCPLGSSTDINYVLPDGLQIPGRLYQSDNRRTTYYQFYIIKSDDKNLFRQIVKSNRILNLNF